MSDYIISTERLGLRLWQPEDFIPFAEMGRDRDVMEYFPSLLTNDETKTMMQRIENHFVKHGFGLYAVETKASKQFIGYTGFMVPSFESFFTPCIEIGWRLHRSAWGKGYATEAAKACLLYGFATLQFDKVYSFTSLINARSEKVMQKIGMQKIGEFNHPKIVEGDRLCRHVLYISSSNHFS